MDAKVKTIYLLNLRYPGSCRVWPDEVWVELKKINGQKMSMDRRCSAARLLERLSH